MVGMISRGFLRWLFVVVCALPGFVRSQPSYPAGQPLIATPQLNGWRLTGGNGLATQVEVAGPGFTRAWRIETRVDASPPWAIEFRAAVNRAVAKGDVGLVRFVARAVATSD